MARRAAQDRSVLALSGLLLATLALVAPAGYLVVALRYKAGALETEAAAVAGALDDLVSSNPDLWRFEQVRLEEILQRQLAPGPPRAHRAVALDGTVVATNGVDVAPPTLERHAPILDAGAPAGRVEVAWSARPVVIRAVLLAAFLGLVAAGVFRLVRQALRRAAAERAAMEEQLRQSARLETVGRLAGGVAHDFNNVFAAVLALARELRRELPPGSPQLEVAEDILAASQRGAQLTRSLQAFSRQQALGACRADAGELLRGLERRVQETLAPGQRLELELAAVPLPVEVDPVQLELVLVNLATNARDAMGPSGTLRVATAAVSGGASGDGPADHVRIVVRDDGAGMAEETRQRAFDPFFTTKPVGRGAGLGLAIVHGIVQQHRGSVEVSSAVGQGTEVTILLPRAPDAAVATAGGAGASRADSG